jgi:hypothetical protein
MIPQGGGYANDSAKRRLLLGQTLRYRQRPQSRIIDVSFSLRRGYANGLRRA